MIHDPANAPATRNWRDIPQPVVPRSMSRGGRWRLALAALRVGFAVTFVALLIWGGWCLVGALQESPGAMPASARSVAVKPPELRTNGVLSRDWLVRSLALAPGASLMELDLEKLRARLLLDGQILSAALTRNFPDRLVVTVSERSPVARVMADWKGRRQPLLVGGDGVVFAGEGFDPAMIDGLPWLDGVTLARREGSFLPIEGMERVAELLAKARDTDPRPGPDAMTRAWRVISLARLASDRELEVRTARGTTIVFATNGDLFRQVAKLDFMWDTFSHASDAPARIDLSLGREVPVVVDVTMPKMESSGAASPLFVAPPFRAKPR